MSTSVALSPVDTTGAFTSRVVGASEVMIGVLVVVATIIVVGMDVVVGISVVMMGVGVVGMDVVVGISVVMMIVSVGVPWMSVGVGITLVMMGVGVWVKGVGVAWGGVSVGVAWLRVGVGVGVAWGGVSVPWISVGVGVAGIGVGVGVAGIGVGVAGTGVGVEGIIGTHPLAEKVFVSNVTAPLRANALPEMVAPLFNVMLTNARMFPTNKVATPTVAELPTCQYTLHGEAPLITSTDELLAVVSVLPIWNTKTALGSPWASRMSCPVSCADVAKK